MDWIILVVAGIALICPAMMFGPMLLQRLGLRKSARGASCMDMAHGEQQAQNLAELHSRRAEIDRDIKRIQQDAAAAGERERV